MDTFLLTDWITISGDGGVGAGNITSIAQSTDQWLELPEHEDFSFVLEVKQVTGTVTMNVETAPTKQDSSFVAVLTPFAMSVGTRSDSALFSNALVPVSQFLRWRLSNPGGSGVWNATFRLWVSASSYGGT
jgi:hypothetical protein